MFHGIIAKSKFRNNNIKTTDMSLQTEKIRELVQKRAKARLGGGEKAIEKYYGEGNTLVKEVISE